MHSGRPRRAAWRDTLANTIDSTDTGAGRLFDLVLIAAILLSVLAVMLDSVRPYQIRFGTVLRQLEWTLTILFTLEYVVRLITARHARVYARSFFGLVDLLSILPTYIALLIPGAQYLLILRVLRLLRIFRILKLARYLSEASVLITTLRASVAKITVFLAVAVTMVVIIGTLM
ncbi:hypothetical protein GCM10008955_32080 [Deinococcus malanensis]|uniref:Ion transport domain-containing protein n=1 Tax=Deinococcus malanensis TaxID=1706855 RepID=A0ABQ2F0H8_9DEIO|nr:hypothetical protein GCM10008955_32080 [Deinococcus malanensis]